MAEVIEMSIYKCAKQANRAIGVIEGVAAGLRKELEDLLMGSCEVIDQTLEKYEAWQGEREEDFFKDQARIQELLRQKDELLTENGKLRSILEEIATSPAAPRNDSEDLNVLRENATDPAELRNDNAGMGKRAAKTSETVGGCEVCRGMKLLWEDGISDITVEIKRGRMVIETGEYEVDASIEYCPNCGRKL